MNESRPEQEIRVEEELRKLRDEQDKLLQEYHTADPQRREEIAARYKEIDRLVENLLFGETIE